MEKVERGRDDKVEGRNEGEKGDRLKRRGGGEYRRRWTSLQCVEDACLQREELGK